MRKKKSDEPKKLKLPIGIQAQSLIDAQTAEFLKSGGKVDRIPNGVSGYKEAIKQQPVAARKKLAQRTVATQEGQHSA